MDQRARYVILILITFAVAWICWVNWREPQPLEYHDFASQRQILGIPNGCDVLSNFAFLVVGVWGLAIVLSKKGQERRFINPLEKIPYLVFFTGVIFVSLGSGYYHHSPDNETLIWDRLPMTIGFVAFFASALMERVSIKIGILTLFPGLVLGAATVFYWSWTESLGQGDLRPYYFVQFYPLVAVAALMALFPARYTGAIYLFFALVFYASAKVLEAMDQEVFKHTGGFVSGHMLKHLTAAFGIALLVRMIKNRRPLISDGKVA